MLVKAGPGGARTPARRAPTGYLDKSGQPAATTATSSPRVYSYVTENESSSASRATFSTPRYVLKCVLYFERLYDDNMRAFDTPGGKSRGHWKFSVRADRCAPRRPPEAASRLKHDQQVTSGIPGAFGTAAALAAVTARVLGAMSSLTEVSMKAHIRYDLPRAESWVFNQDYRRHARRGPGRLHAGLHVHERRLRPRGGGDAARHGRPARRAGRPDPAHGSGHVDGLPVRRRHGDRARRHLASCGRARERAPERHGPLLARSRPAPSPATRRRPTR